MESNTRAMPAVMQQLHKLLFDYLDGEGIDFDPYEAFLSVKDTREWFRLWTGNAEADASEYMIFGQDGTGGYAAVWLTRDEKDLLAQPIVFFGSEGEMGVVAQNFSDYLWLLASGYGPYETVTQVNDERGANLEFLDFARQHATTSQRKPSQIFATTKLEFPDFEEQILSICK
jgi:hypothetical protein